MLLQVSAEGFSSNIYSLSLSLFFSGGGQGLFWGTSVHVGAVNSAKYVQRRLLRDVVSGDDSVKMLWRSLSLRDLTKITEFSVGSLLGSMPACELDACSEPVEDVRFRIPGSGFN